MLNEGKGWLLDRRAGGGEEGGGGRGSRSWREGGEEGRQHRAVGRKDGSDAVSCQETLEAEHEQQTASSRREGAGTNTSC